VWFTKYNEKTPCQIVDPQRIGFPASVLNTTTTTKNLMRATPPLKLFLNTKEQRKVYFAFFDSPWDLQNTMKKLLAEFFQYFVTPRRIELRFQE
jgi:hypothetical protein